MLGASRTGDGRSPVVGNLGYRSPEADEVLKNEYRNASVLPTTGEVLKHPPQYVEDPAGLSDDV